MRKIFCLLIVLLFGCTSKHTEQLTLEGNWIFYRNSKWVATNYSAFQFEDGIFYRGGISGRTLIGEYSKQINLLKIKNHYNGDTIIYKIIKHTKDTLVLLEDDLELFFYNQLLDYNDNLKLNMLHLDTKNYSTECAQFEAFISKEKDSIEFIRKENEKVIKRKYFNLSRAEWAQMDSLFKWSNISRCDTSQYYGAADNCPIEVELRYNDTSATKIRGSEDYIYYGIKPIVNKIIDKLRKEGAYK